MFAFPVGAASDLVRNNFQSQASLFMNLSQSMANASAQLGELNIQATRKLMEESTSALTKGMQLRTLTDVQSFLAEQSQVTMERMRGYALNVQNILAENAFNATGSRNAPAMKQLGQQGYTQAPPAQTDAAAHSAHETETHASPLVEKLVASAVSDIDKLH